MTDNYEKTDQALQSMVAALKQYGRYGSKLPYAGKVVVSINWFNRFNGAGMGTGA